MTTGLINTLESHNYIITCHNLLVGINSYLRNNNFTQVPQLTSSKHLTNDTVFSNDLSFNSSTKTLGATNFSGNGSALTDLNGANISSGTININIIPNLTQSKITDLTTSSDVSFGSLGLGTSSGDYELNVNGSSGYYELFPEPLSGGDTCADAGVLGMLPGIIGNIQALEAVKLIVGITPNLVGKLLVYDGMSHITQTIELW